MANKWNEKEQGAKRRRSNQGTRGTTQPAASNPNKNRKSTDTNRNSGRAAAKPAPKAAPKQTRPKTVYYSSKNKGSKGVAAGVKAATRAATNTATKKAEAKYPQTKAFRTLSRQAGARNYVTGRDIPLATNKPKTFQQTVTPLEQMKSDAVAGPKYWGARAIVPSKKLTAEEQKKKNQQTAKRSGFNARARKQTLSSYDQKLSQGKQFQIQQAKQRYDEAKAKGDRAGMEKAHREAESLRYTAGYSGGATGNERIAPKLSQDDYNRLNASGRLAMTQAQMTRDRATTEDEIARADRRIEEILNAPGYQNRGRDINTARGMRETAEGRSTMLGATREQREQDAAGLKNATLAGLHLGAGGAGHWLEATDWTIANRNRDQNMAKWLQDADDYESARSDLEYYDNYVQTFGEPPAGMNRNVLQMRLNNATQAKAQLERMQTDPHSAYYDETVAQRLGMSTDTQSYWEKMIRQGQQEQLASQEGLSPAEKWINDLYISGIQTIPTTAAALIPGGQGGALAGLASAARGLALAGMGASAAGNRMTELQDAGQAFDQAYRNATVAGIIEAGTEMIGVEKLASAAAGKVPQNALRAILEQGLAEGGEEALSYALNTGYNKLADLPGQEWSWKDFASQAASGAVMGAVHMGAGVMINSLAASGAVSQERAQRSYQAWQASADQARSLLNDAKQWYAMMDQGAVSQEEAEAALSQVSQQINGQAEPVTREWLARQEELLDIEENAIRGAITRQEARDQQSQILDQVTAQSRDNEANRMAAEWDEEERQARAAQNAAVSARTRLDQRLEDWRWRQDEPVSVNPMEQAERMTAEALRATDAEMARRDAVAQLQAETPPITYERSGLPPTSFLGAAIDARREARARAEAEAQVRRDQEIARQNRVAAEAASNSVPTFIQLSSNAETGQQAQPPVSRLEGLASTFGESGAASLRTIGGKMVTGQGAFVRDFTDVYNQVLGGRSESQVSRPAGMSDANYFAAVTAAQNDRQTGWDLDILKASKAAGRNVNAGVDWRDQYVRQMDRKTARTVDGLAKALGVKVVFAEKGSILTAGGTAANAEITGNVVRIEKDNPNPVRMLIGHELTHRMQDVSPESYRAFRDYVMSRPGSMETLERTVARYREAKAFRAEDNVQLMAMDEVTADAAGELLENSEQLKEFIRRNYENRTMLEVIRDFFRDLSAKLTGRQKAQADEAVRLLEEAIKGASKQLKQNESQEQRSVNDRSTRDKAFPETAGARFSITAEDGYSVSGSTASYTDERIDTVLKEYGGGGNYAQGFVTYIDPNDFLKLTLSDATRAKWEGGLDNGEFPEEFFPLDEEKLRGNRQSPYLRVDTATGEVEGHEGRHRMLALARAGINKAPVVLVDTATKYSKEPTAQMRLTSQDFGRGPVNNGYAVTVENLLPTNKQYRDQIKEAYGSENAKVRFSLSAPVEETKTLVALHNLDAEKIDRSLRLGAFPAPSIAVVKAKEGHSKFGPISIVFPRSTIDPEASRKNRVYGSDAWTPTHSNARVEYPVNYDALLRIEKQLEELSGQVAGGTFRGNSLLRRRGLDDDSSMDRKELAERLSGDDEVRAAYLAAQGRTLEPVMREKEFDAMGNDFLQTILDTVGEQEIAGMTATLMEGGRLTEADKGTLREIWRQNWIKSLPKRIREKRSPEFIEEKSHNRAAELSDFKMEQFVRHTWDYYENHGVKGDEIDRIATSDKLRAAVNDADVTAWMEDQLDGLLGEPGVYNGKEPYTASGNKRSFATLHYPYTAEGIVRAMFESTTGSRGQNAWGVNANTLISVATPEYGSVDEIHADEDRLRQLPEEEYKALLAPIDAEITSFIQGVKKTNKAFAASDYEEGEIIASILMDNAGKKTAKAIQSGFRKEGYTLSPELAKSALDIFKQARAVPTGYFEAKPERVVGFDEVLAAVVPSDMDAGLRSRMEEAGMRLIDYERDNEQSRMDAVNSVEGARFSITSQADADAIGTHDSEGYTLTKGQREYFKDSQVTDERGRLLRVYHGTPAGGFTEFREANNTGYFFTRSRSMAQTYSGGGDEFAPERAETWEDAQAMAKEYGLELFEENGGWTLKHSWGEEFFGPNDLDEAADTILKEVEGERMEYVGYLNLTNPLVVEGHGAYWNKISGVGADGHRDRIELWEDLGKYHIRLSDEMDPEKLRDMEEIKASPEELREILTDYYAEETADRIIDDWIEAGFSPQDFELLSDADGHETRERTTLEWVWDAVDGGYDGVIFHNIIDEGRYGGADEVTDVYVALDSNQFKSVNNWNPTKDEDIRYSIGDMERDDTRRVWANIGNGYYVAGGDTFTLGGIFNNREVRIPASAPETLTVYEAPRSDGFVDGKYIVGDYTNAILENGNFVTYDRENMRYTVMEAVRNEIAILGGEKEPGVFYRITNNKKEVSLAKSGQMRNSVNHANGEEELGVSVWDRVLYANKKYAYKVTGDVVAVGSDGEPVLDPKTIKVVGPIKTMEDVFKQRFEAQEKGKLMFKAKYKWTDEQIYQALHGGYKKAYLEDIMDADDIRYSIGTEGYDRARLMRENQELKEKLEFWRAQVKKSDRTKADPKEVRKLAKSLRTDYSTEMDADEITRRLQAIYDGIGKDWSYDRAYEEAGKLARDMIEQATATEDYLYAEYEPMRKFFKDTPLVVTKEMQRAIPDYNEWRKPLFGKLRLKGGEKTNVDQVFQEAVERWPEFFNEEVSSHSLDQLDRIVEVLDNVYRRDTINPFEDDMSTPAGYLATEIMDMFWDVPAVKKTFADRAEARLAQQIEKTNQAKEQGRERVQAEREKGNARVRAERERGAQRVQAVREQRDRTISKLRADHKEKYEKALQRARERREQALKKQSERYLTAKKKRSQQQKERELRAKIVRHVNKLSTKLTRPTDTQHIPEALVDTVRTALESINLASKDMKDTKRTQAFAALQKMYQEMETNGSEVVIDPDLIPNISDIIGFADTPIANLGLEDLNTIWQTVRAIEASISTFNKTLGRAKFETISQPAFGIRDYLTGRKDRGDYRGPFRQMDKLLNFNMLTPEAYFLRMGNSGKEVFRMLRDAQDRHITIMDQAQRKTREIVGKTDIRKLEKEKHTFTFDGETVELTTAQIMSLYELMKRQQAVDHVMIGGIRPESVKKGIKDLPPARPWHLTQDQVSAIVDSLTEEQVKLADELQKYMGGTMAELGNEASMEVYGYRKFTEKHYFPISVDKNQTQSDVKNDAVSGTIAGWGSARPVKPNANNAVILRSIFDVYADHTTEMANYASWLAPMENMNRIFNFRYKDAEGNQTGTMKDQLETLFGKNGEAYWKQLQNDLNNGVHGRDDSPFSAFMGTYKASAIGANIRVIAQQPTAILRAMDSINPADFVAGMARARIGKFDNVVKQYAPIAIWKDWGYFQQDTGRQMRNVLFNDDTKLQKANSAMMWGAGKADSLSWTAIWNALESETRRKRKDLRYKSREFYEAVAERFNEVVDHTQVVDGILQRSQIMRSADGLTKMATSFMAEPTKTYNMMLSAIYEARNAKGRERSAAMGKLAKTAFALTVSITVNAAAQSLVDAIRDDDKDEDYWEKFIQAYFGLEGDTRKEQIKNGILNGNLEAAFNPLTYIPYLKDIVSQTQGYSVSRMDMDTISRVLKAFTNVEKAMSGEGKNTKQSAWLNLTAEIARFLGVPAANIKRDIQTISRTFFAGTGNYRMLYAQEKFLYDVTSKNTLTEFSKLILGAERAGDNEAAQAIRQDMIDSGVDAEKIDKKLAELRKKAVTDTEEYQTALAQKTDAYQTMLEADARFNGLDEDKQENVRKRLNDYAQYQVLGQSMDVENDKMEKIADAESHKVPAADWVVFTAAADAIEADYKPDGTLIQGSKKKKVVALIDSYDVSNEGKSYMYLSQGYSEKDNSYQ